MCLNWRLMYAIHVSLKTIFRTRNTLCSRVYDHVLSYYCRLLCPRVLSMRVFRNVDHTTVAHNRVVCVAARNPRFPCSQSILKFIGMLAVSLPFLHYSPRIRVKEARLIRILPISSLSLHLFQVAHLYMYLFLLFKRICLKSNTIFSKGIFLKSGNG